MCMGIKAAEVSVDGIKEYIRNKIDWLTRRVNKKTDVEIALSDDGDDRCSATTAADISVIGRIDPTHRPYAWLSQEKSGPFFIFSSGSYVERLFITWMVGSA